ncbi:quinone oxidoreductase family protein [Aestuariivirga sp.]|uniref:quinone oxidoreductase family protein n=1 Tax=Aestuariivirga sp. TaxID=2650926 RepID=UPI003BA9177A
MTDIHYAIAAARPGGPDVLQQTELSLPPPAAGEVQIRHRAIGVNFIDCYFRSGLYPWPDPQRLVPGAEAAGEIIAVGPGVTALREGDRVAYTLPNNAYASARNIAAAHVVILPDGLSFETAASVMLKGLTTRYLLKDSYRLQAGEQVLFHAAAGGVGLLAGQWMRVIGVEPVGTAGGPAKCDLALSNGFATMIDYREQDFLEAARALVPEGFHAVYDSVGKDTLLKSLKCLRLHGSLVNFGQSSGAVSDFRIADLAAGSFHLTRPVLFHFTSNRRWLEKASEELFGLILDGRIRVQTQTAPLTSAAQVHADLEGRKTTGSTVLIP